MFCLKNELCSIVVTAVELNDQHGTGIFAQKLISKKSNVLIFCSKFIYGGANNHVNLSDYRNFDAAIQKNLQSKRVDKILCIPYFQDNFKFAVALKKATQAKLCTFFMDDQNIFCNQVPDSDVQKLIDHSDLILAISPEMADAYLNKYKKNVYFFPPLVSPRVKILNSCWSATASNSLSRGAMIGNIWSQRRLQQILDLLGKTRIQIDWYGHGGKAPWFQGSKEEWAKTGLHYHGWLEEGDLLTKLAGYPFILLPSGEMDESDDKLSFSRLSLPSRLVFLNARVGVPVLVLGHPETAAARFVRRYGTGISAPAKPDPFLAALAQLGNPKIRENLQQNLAKNAKLWSCDDPGAAIWEAMEGNMAPLCEILSTM